MLSKKSIATTLATNKGKIASVRSYWKSNWRKLAFAAIFTTLAVIYQFWPQILAINPVVIVLLVIAASPWLLPMLASRVENLEVSTSGFKITLRDVKAAGEKIVGISGQVGVTGQLEAKVQPFTTTLNGTVVPPEKAENSPSYLAVYERDPNLALVALRIEIEKRVELLLDEYRPVRPMSTPQYPLSKRIANLEKIGVFEPEEAKGINELVRVGSEAAHGASVDKEVARWAIENAPKILAVLDSKLRR